MNLERWKRVEQIYHDVLASAPDARVAILNEQCASDPDLREEVESLLDAREDAGEFLSPEGLRSHIANLGSSSAPKAGSTLGAYEILGILGTGGMAVVYRARDLRLDRLVALKVLPADFAGDPERVTRFHREARAASTLNHPNIVTIYEIGQANDVWYIAAELIEGGTVRERLAGGRLPLQEAVDIALQCATALDTAHRAGIVHRDIKPENIMLRKDGVVKVVDFGLARITEIREAAPSDSIFLPTQTTALMGTPRYMSPEHARGLKLDARTDIFSLGAVLHEMALGRPAIEGKTPPEIFAALLSSGSPIIPPGRTKLEAVLSKALQKNREARYQTMAEMAEDLRAVDPRQETTTRLEYPPAAPEAPPFWNMLLRHPGRAAVLALLALAAILAPIVYRWPGRNRTPDASLTLTPLTSFAGYKDYAAFSPDGSRFAFSWNGGKPELADRHIYVKPLAGGDPVQLTFAPQDDERPEWSPDGASIAFMRRFSRLQRAVYIVPAAGGAERRIADSGNGVCWSPDGQWLALAAPSSASGAGGLLLISLKTGERRQLTQLASGSDISPAYSPNGQWIAFLRQSPNPDVYVIPAGGDPSRQSPRRLTFDSKPKTGSVTWTADSREVVYSTQREYGGEGLWRVPVQGGETRRISSTLLFAGNPNISRKGDRLAYTESWIDTNIYLSQGPGFTHAGPPGAFGEGVKLIASSREDHSPGFSADGERIVFVSNRTGHSEIWTARRDGSRQTQLTYFESFTGTPRWSPDGRWIAFDCIVAGNADIYVIAAGGGQPRRLTDHPSPDTKPAWSPDGQWIYFNSDRSGAPQVWKIKPDGSSATQVTFNLGREPLPSPDGQTIYYTKRPGPAQVWSVPAAGGPEQPVHGMEEFDQIGRLWGVLPGGIYFVSQERGTLPSSIRFFDFATGKVAVLGLWPGKVLPAAPALAISPDGRYELMVHTDSEINDLMMIENFR